jgi:hypothetical protein
VILDDGRQHENAYSIRLYALHELGQLLHSVGFRVAEVTGHVGTPGVHFGSDSPRSIMLAERRKDDDRRADSSTNMRAVRPPSSPPLEGPRRQDSIPTAELEVDELEVEPDPDPEPGSGPPPA